MTLLDYIFCFLAGALLANAVPHFVHGISGDRFPTPFANPPGKGTLNVAWSLFNLVLGYILFRLGQVLSGGALAFLAFLRRVTVMSSRVNLPFSHEQRDNQESAAGVKETG